MKAKEFKEKFQKSERIKEGLDLIDKLSYEDKNILSSSLRVVEQFTGLTMRNEWLLRELEFQLKRGEQ